MGACSWPPGTLQVVTPLTPLGPTGPTKHGTAAATPSSPVPAKQPLLQAAAGAPVEEAVKALASAGRQGPGGEREGGPRFEARAPPGR